MIFNNIRNLLTSILILKMVAQTSGCLDLIYILTTRTTRSEGLPNNIGRIYHNLYTVIHGRGYGNRCEGCLTLVVGIKWRQAHHTMHSVLALEISVGKLALHLHGARLYTHLIARLIVEHLDLISVRLAPTGVHTEQHISPIERLRTACTGINIDNRTHLILLTAEHIAQLESLHSLKRIGIEGIKFLLRCNTLGNKVGHHIKLLDLCRYGVKVCQPALYAGNLLQLTLRRLGVVPEVRFEGLLLLVLQIYSSTIDVKDTSSAYPDAL